MVSEYRRTIAALPDDDFEGRKDLTMAFMPSGAIGPRGLTKHIPVEYVDHHIR